MPLVFEVEVRDDNLVHGKDDQGNDVARPRNSRWWQRYRFENETDVGVAGARAIQHARAKWPGATSYEVRPLPETASAPNIEELETRLVVPTRTN